MDTVRFLARLLAAAGLFTADLRCGRGSTSAALSSASEGSVCVQWSVVDLWLTLRLGLLL
jgi:hypothetical protein